MKLLLVVLIIMVSDYCYTKFSVLIVVIKVPTKLGINMFNLLSKKFKKAGMKIPTPLVTVVKPVLNGSMLIYFLPELESTLI